MVNLALKHRPTTFDEIVGQRLLARVSAKMVENNDVPQGLLFSGPSGTGKTTLARVLAAAIDASDVLEIDAASNGGVDNIRALLDTLRYGHEGKYRVVIIDEAHSVTREGFEALLKPIEEPSSGTIFILVTTEPDRIPDTVKSRLFEFEFRRITPSELFDRMVQVADVEQIKVPTELLLDIAQRSEGSARVALNLLDQVNRAGINFRSEYDELVGIHDAAPKIVSAMISGDGAHALEVLDEELQSVGSPSAVAAQITRLFRDIFVLRGGGNLNISGVALEERERLAGSIEIERVYAAIKLMWDLKTRTRVSDDPRGNLESAVILVHEVLNRGRETPAPRPTPAPKPAPVAEAPRKITLAEMDEEL